MRTARRWFIPGQCLTSRVPQRSIPDRQRHRADRFAAHFETATEQTIYWPDLTVRPNLDFGINQLVALTDEQGFVEALGRVEPVDRDAYTVTVETPP